MQVYWLMDQHSIPLPGTIFPVGRFRNGFRSPFTVAGPRRISTCFPLSFYDQKNTSMLFD